MKLYIKLNKAETEGWNHIKEMAGQGEKVNEDELAKVLFFRGVNVFIDDLKKAAEKAMLEKKAEDKDEAKESDATDN